MNLTWNKWWAMLASLSFMCLCVGLVVLALLMTGCATAQVPKAVNMAIKTDCHPQAIAVPKWIANRMTADTDIYGQAQLLLAERKQREDYERLLEAANKACQ